MKNTNTYQPEMIFTMGLPAAGKSTVADERFSDTHEFIDPDAIKESHPNYNPEKPQDTHTWSQHIVNAMFDKALQNPSQNYLIDGTGTNAEKMVYRMKLAEAVGYKIKLVYVTCSLETSLRRASKRERRVPEWVIREKAEVIKVSFEIISEYADEIERIENDIDR